jgi:hypothetical protein
LTAIDLKILLANWSNPDHFVGGISFGWVPPAHELPQFFRWIVGLDGRIGSIDRVIDLPIYKKINIP